MTIHATHRRLAGAFAIVAAALIAAQPPLSSPAARQFSPLQFVFLTQVGLAASLPLLLATADSRRDFAAVLCRANVGRLAALFAAGMAALVLYTVALAGAHPVVVVAILNLTPFWAALVARLLTKTPIPVSPATFFFCLALSFVGATAVAWSQAGGDNAGLAAELLRGTWAFALPIPLFASLQGTLTGTWFGDLNASGAIAANVFVGAAALIPATLALLLVRGESLLPALGPALLMIVGIILADAVGRVFTQKALQVTDNDNGFVTMFQNLEPAIAALLSIALAPFIAGLGFAANRLFFAGLALTGAGLSVFSWRALRRPVAAAPDAGDVPIAGAVTADD